MSIGQLFESTTINPVDSQTVLRMNDDVITSASWVGNIVTIEDSSTGNINVRWVAASNGTNDTITLSSAPGFTVEVGDVVRVESRMHPIYALQNYDAAVGTTTSAEQDEILDKMLAYFSLITRKERI